MAIKTQIVVGNSYDDDELNQMIQDYENDGYEVVGTNVASGSGFSKYERYAVIVITMTKTV